jgi:segregation and condensation protein B
LDEKSLIEAALFAAGRPVSEQQLKGMINRSNTFLNSLVDGLAEEYRLRNSPMEIIRIEDKVVMQLKTEFADRVSGMAQGEMRPTILRTLSIIAYYQPIQQADLISVRGQAAYEHVALLLEKNLVEKKRVGRSFELTTTEHFCDYFGLAQGDVDSIKDQIKNKAKFKKQSLAKWIETKVPEADAFKAVKKLVPQSN